MRKVVYPFSKLKNHHWDYTGLLYDFFDTLYYGVYVSICPNHDSIDILIYHVNDWAFYNPLNFDPEYRVKDIRTNNSYMIGIQSLFDDIYNYMPDLCPYIRFKLFSSLKHDLIAEFDLKDRFYQNEQRKRMGRINNSFTDFSLTNYLY
jgi:hypothetical protein